MQKIFDFRAGSYVFVDDDDVVQEPTNIIRPRVKQIKCLACQRNEKEGSIATVCVNCCANPTDTLAHVYHVAEATRERLHACGDAWEGALARADEPLMDRFTAYQTTADSAARASANAAAQRGVIGPLADLIRLWLDYQQAQTTSREIEAWVHRCEEVLR